MTAPKVYLTVAEAAMWTHRSERTIRRWMNLGLLPIYQEGKTHVLKLDELSRVERAQDQLNPIRTTRRQRFAQVRSMAYPPE